MNKFIKYVFIILIVTFLALYFSFGMGYFEYANGKKAALTQEEIKKFEEDIQNGKEVDAINYIYEKGNYQNNISKIGLTISSVSYKLINKGVKVSFKVLEKLTN